MQNNNNTYLMAFGIKIMESHDIDTLIFKVLKFIENEIKFPGKTSC